jgi:transposase-like protein
MRDRDRFHQYIYGHNLSKNHIGRIKKSGYWNIFRPDHRDADKCGYVREHRIVYEEYHHCCLLPWSEIHHLDSNKENNKIDNLVLTSKWEHRNKFHRQNFDQVCKRCASTNIVRKGFQMGKQTFRCNICRLSWTVNKKQGVDYGQFCRNCGSKHVVRCGIQNGKQQFRCKDCRENWRVPVADLIVVVVGQQLLFMQDHIS